MPEIPNRWKKEMEGMTPEEADRIKKAPDRQRTVQDAAREAQGKQMLQEFFSGRTVGDEIDHLNAQISMLKRQKGFSSADQTAIHQYQAELDVLKKFRRSDNLDQAMRSFGSGLHDW